MYLVLASAIIIATYYFLYYNLINKMEILSFLSRLYLFLLLILTIDANVQENTALFDVRCDDFGMHIQMNFTHPFKGIVFTENNYYNPDCSYAASPTSTSRLLNLTLPYGLCGMQYSNETVAFNTIIVLQHRMLDTVHDFIQNVSCLLPGPIVNTSGTFEYIKVDSWIKLELGESLFPEGTAEKKGISSKLLLTYHVSDGGAHQDMIVMNCIGHDELVIDESTKLYQISNPYGCVSDSDFVSNFSIIKNLNRVSDMVAYAVLKNVSMFIRGKFYITCGAKLCETACERRCEEIDQQNEPLYFDDMATKNMVNRAPSSQMPSSLTEFERFERNRRSYNETAVNLVFKDIEKDQTVDLIHKLSEFILKQHEVNSKNLLANSSLINKLNTKDEVLGSRVGSSIRQKRAVTFQKDSLSTDFSDMVLKYVEKDGTTNLTTVTNKASNLIYEKLTEQLPEETKNDTQEAKVSAGNFTFPHVFRYIKKSESSALMCTVRALITIFALFCISFACYSVFLSTRDIGFLAF